MIPKLPPPPPHQIIRRGLHPVVAALLMIEIGLGALIAGWLVVRCFP
jgi:hypothetical protein